MILILVIISGAKISMFWLIWFYLWFYIVFKNNTSSFNYHMFKKLKIIYHQNVKNFGIKFILKMIIMAIKLEIVIYLILNMMNGISEKCPYLILIFIIRFKNHYSLNLLRLILLLNLFEKFTNENFDLIL